MKAHEFFLAALTAVLYLISGQGSPSRESRHLSAGSRTPATGTGLRLPSGWVNNEFKGWLNSCSFADELNGWILGDHGQAYQTSDGGASWQSRSSQLSRVIGARLRVSPDFKEVRFFTKDVGFMIVEYLDSRESKTSHVIRGSTLAILSTENGGRSWIRRRKFQTRPFVRAYFLSENE